MSVSYFRPCVARDGRTGGPVSKPPPGGMASPQKSRADEQPERRPRLMGDENGLHSMEKQQSKVYNVFTISEHVWRSKQVECVRNVVEASFSSLLKMIGETTTESREELEGFMIGKPGRTTSEEKETWEVKATKPEEEMWES